MHKSCLYEGRVMHERREPVHNLFHYPLFLFALDLDELDLLDGRLRLFRHNGRALFALRDGDHFQGFRQPGESRSTGGSPSLKEIVCGVLRSHGLPAAERVVLATSLRVLGYVFNPVSFFYCYGPNEDLIAVMAEVTNTYREQKLYVVAAASRDRVRSRMAKNFYVSPFVAPDADFAFHLPAPGERLLARIDAEESGTTAVKAVFAARRVALTDANLLRFFVRYGMNTALVMFRIHFQAFRLWVRRVPHFGKSEAERIIVGGGDRARAAVASGVATWNRLDGH